MVATVVLGGEDMNGIAVGARATRWARGCSHPASDASGPGAIRAMSSLGVNAAPAGCLTRDSEPAARPGEELVPVPTREPPERTGCRPPARVRPVVAARVRADSGVHALAGPSSGGRASQCPRRTMRRGTGRIRPPVPDGERRAPGFRHPGTALPRRPRRAVWLGGRLRAAESRRREIQPPLAPANTEAVGGVISAVELLRTLPDHLPGTLAVRACGAHRGTGATSVGARQSAPGAGLRALGRRVPTSWGGEAPCCPRRVPGGPHRAGPDPSGRAGSSPTRGPRCASSGPRPASGAASPARWRRAGIVGRGSAGGPLVGTVGWRARRPDASAGEEGATGCSGV